MPPRLNKRQQRELEELQELGSATLHEDAPSANEDNVDVTSSSGFSAFLLNEDVVDEQESEEESAKNTKARKPKKKKKKSGIDSPVPSGNATPETTKSFKSTSAPVIRNEKKALKKARAKEKKAGDDELNQALAELSVKYPELQAVADSKPGSSSTSSPALIELLSVSLAHLDSEAEMRKFFGSKVHIRAGAPARGKPGILRSNLTRPQSTWWAAKQREGLSIRTLTDDEMSGKMLRHSWNSLEDKWWTIEYSKKYKSMTKSFMQTVLSGDPQGFWDLLGKLPWHADTLLQVSEVYRHREEHAQAIDFIDRAIFTYERSFLGAFNFTSGLNRLDFDRVECRPFFLAIHRQSRSDLHRRGCSRTAFEFARLLYSLDPWGDPHGAALHIDLLALKAGMHKWLISAHEVFQNRRIQRTAPLDARLDPSLLPGWSYARALAMWMLEKAEKRGEHTASTAALVEAMKSFPSVVPLLADKIEVSLPASITSHHDFRIETDASGLSTPTAILHLLSHLYAQRSSSYSVYRHIMVLESTYRRLFSFIPRAVLEMKSLSCDPLPPPTSVTAYDEEFFAGIDDILSLRARTRQQRAADERRLAQFIPDAAFRQQLQALGQLPPDVVEDMMLAEAMGAGDAEPMPRVIRNLLGRLWGRPAAEEDSSDDEADAPIDDTGVD
ncbi:transcriptional repressor TCF25-domain-containing protein [Infundibulicybe gibba]|nr:transcriptional repressor TCF25-domain-containing protein [Infundibulicybe gibba]